MINNNNIFEFLKFDKVNILFYLIVGVILIYIWKRSNISINYFFPFIILLMIVYIRQLYLYKNKINASNNLEKIKNKILKENYNNLKNNREILYWLDDIYIYIIYNSTNFKLFLDLLNKFYSNNDIYYLHLCLKSYDQFFLSLPINLAKNNYIKKLELIKILKTNLKDPKYKMIEMQSYIPYNFITDNFDYLI